MISKPDLIRALDNSTPYPIELDATLMDYMANQLLDMLVIEKNESHEVWQPDPEPENPGGVDIPIGTPPGPQN